MKVATWNVNSIRARLPNVLTWLNENPLDVLLLQEIKCIDDNFPFSEFEKIGYNVLVNGQKAYNGVAILSRSILKNSHTNCIGWRNYGNMPKTFL